MDYKDAMAIDRNNLDEEAIQIPGWYGNVVEKEAEAADELAALTDQMKILQADLSLAIRGWSIQQINVFFGLALTKLTEGAYTSLVQIHPEVIELNNRIIEARHRKSIFGAATRSIEKKADMLKELAKLYAQGYFMRIEGKEYKKPQIDLMIDKLKIQVIGRAKKEEVTKPPLDAAMKELQDRINNKLGPGNLPVSPVSTPAAGTPMPKTPKTPKTAQKTAAAGPKRVK